MEAAYFPLISLQEDIICEKIYVFSEKDLLYRNYIFNGDICRMI